MHRDVALTVNGEEVHTDLAGRTLLSILRDDCGLVSVKDGCSPQGQCGCCTVLVDGQPRVSCVTPARRVAGREITTAEGLDRDRAEAWAGAFCSSGGSQCGFCTPGIVMRLEGLTRKVRSDAPDEDQITRALSAHLCRCTGWQTIIEAVAGFDATSASVEPGAAERAELEGHTPQRVGPDVVLGAGGFADDRAPADALVAVRSGDGEWVLGETLDDARAAAGKVQGRRTTLSASHPLEIPEGDWDLGLRTAWVDPGYLETDAAWCEPGGAPASPLANGGAFGGKVDSEVTATARRLADESGRAVRVLWSREDVARHAPKRPPIAAGIAADGTGVMRVVATDGIVERVEAVAPGLRVEPVEVPGPPTSAALRGAGTVEAAVLRAALGDGPVEMTLPGTGTAGVSIADDGAISVAVDAGDPLAPTVLRSYCIGAAHMALSWVTSESLVVDEDGSVRDLTVRSLGVVPASAMPHVDVEIVESSAPPVNGSDAVFAAVAAAVWRARGLPPDWPTG